MRKLDFYIILTADGMYADPDGGLDHYEPAEDEHRYANGLIHDAGEIVYGRAMYDVMRYWDTVDDRRSRASRVEREFARFWAETPKRSSLAGSPSSVRPRATSRAMSSRRSVGSRKSRA
jgi:dihydrofolate reductase